MTSGKCSCRGAARPISISFGPAVHPGCEPAAGASVTSTNTGAATTNGAGVGVELKAGIGRLVDDRSDCADEIVMAMAPGVAIGPVTPGMEDRRRKRSNDRRRVGRREGRNGERGHERGNSQRDFHDASP